MKNTIRSLVLLFVMVGMFMFAISTYAQVAPPSMACAIADNGDGTVTATFVLNTDGAEIDTGRLEILYDSAALSNPAAAIGSDFNTPGIDATTTAPSGLEFLLQTYGINGSTGSGALDFATITFSWTGDPTMITVQGIDNTEVGQGSLQVLVGESTPVNGGTCSIPDDGGTDPTPEPTPDTGGGGTVAPPSMTCAIVDNGDGTVTASFMLNTDGAEIDTGRLEILYDTAALSNPAVAIGADFNTPGIDATTTAPSGLQFLLQTYGINGSTGSGMLDFAMITFDWTEAPTTITVQGIGTTEVGQGSLQVLVGESTPLNGDTCSIPDDGGTDPEPTQTTVVDIVVDSAAHTTLEDAVVAAGLAPTLSDLNSTFTVFAPTDATLSAAGLDASALTAAVLTNHAISGAAVMSGDITDGMTAETVAGNTLTFMLDGGMVKIEGLVDGFVGVVETADLTADNGVVHSITFEAVTPDPDPDPDPDPVTVAPPSMTCAIADNGDGTVTASFMLNTDGAEIDTGRLEILYDTVALSNPAVAIGSDFNTPGIDATTTAPSGLQFLLQTYGINGSTGSGMLDFAMITFDWTEAPTTITVQGIGTTEVGQGSLQVLVGESTPLNGGTCSIPDETTVFDIIAGSASHTLLESELTATGLDTPLSDLEATYTVFAPNDTSVGALEGTVEFTTEILQNHVLTTEILSGDITDGMTVTTLDNKTLTIRIVEGDVVIEGLIEGVNQWGLVETADLQADNGVVHSIRFVPTAVSLSSINTSSVGTMMVMLSLAVLLLATPVVVRRS